MKNMTKHSDNTRNMFEVNTTKCGLHSAANINLR